MVPVNFWNNELLLSTRVIIETLNLRDGSKNLGLQPSSHHVTELHVSLTKNVKSNGTVSVSGSITTVHHYWWNEHTNEDFLDKLSNISRDIIDALSPTNSFNGYTFVSENLKVFVILSFFKNTSPCFKISKGWLVIGRTNLDQSQWIDHIIRLSILRFA